MTQHFTKIDQERRIFCKIEKIGICIPMTTRFIMLTLIYVISMEFLSLKGRRSSSRNVPSGEERGARRTAVFAGYLAGNISTIFQVNNRFDVQ